MSSPPRKPDRESHTAPILLWREACSFIQAANEIPHYRTPRLHLAAHGIELALKSFLRAHGYTLEQLRHLRHSLTDVVGECKSLGMEPPSDDDWDRIQFLSEAHESQEWRYAHTDRPRHMEREEWITVAAWALRSAIPAVADDGAESPAQAIALARRMEVDVVRALNPGTA